MAIRTTTIIASLVTAILLTAPAIALPGGAGGNKGGPVKETVDIQFNMTGQAIKTDGGPATFTFYINASGEGVRSTPNGNGVQVRSNDLVAQVVVLDNGTELENFTASLRFHANQAPYVAQGIDGFRFQMQLTGKRSESVLINNNENGRILSFNAHGNTVGEAEEDGVMLVDGRGQATTKDGQGNDADHYNFMLGGTASITTQ